MNELISRLVVNVVNVIDPIVSVWIINANNVHRWPSNIDGNWRIPISFVEEMKVSPFYYIHIVLLQEKLNEKTLMIMRP